jgi:hypothetical protein
MLVDCNTSNLSSLPSLSITCLLFFFLKPLLSRLILSETALEVPLKQLGNPPLKTRNKPKPNAPRLNTQGMAHAAVALTAHQSGPLKDPLEQAPPRSRGCAYLEQAPPRSRVRAALEQAPSRSRALRTRTPVPVHGHLMF